MRNRLMRTLAGFALACFATMAGAQDANDFPVLDTPPAAQISAPILTVDIERLFTQSAFGERIAQEFTEQRDTLATENRRIADALREEELALTEQRATMAANIFRTEAEAFDGKAQAIRRAQDAKASALDDMLTDGRDQFLSVTRPILGQLMIDFGAVAILDRRSVLLSLGSIDITDEAVQRIDAAIGDGTADPSQTITLPEIAPELLPEPEAEIAPEAVPDVAPDN